MVWGMLSVVGNNMGRCWQLLIILPSTGLGDAWDARIYFCPQNCLSMKGTPGLNSIGLIMQQVSFIQR